MSPSKPEAIASPPPPRPAPELAAIPPEDLRAFAAALTPQLVTWRRAFHRYPELSFQELHTAGRLAQELAHLGLPVRTGVARTGVVALLKGARPGRTVLLRADIDALPLHERATHDYVSRQPGVMHACGHDAHMAILLGTAHYLAARRDRFAGQVKLVFQPAEEGPGGADLMIAEGVLADPPVEAAFGFHAWNELPVGVIGVRNGPLLAASDAFELVITGCGAHGADPHLGVDAVVVAAHLVTALQTVVSRQLSPLEPTVLTIGQIQGGSGHNILAEAAVLKGTVRTFCPELRARIPHLIEQLASGVAAAFGARAELRYRPQYPVTVNDPAMTEFVRQAARQIAGPDRVIEAPLSMGSEDMAYFLQQVPGTYFLVGSANPERGWDQPHHHPAFNLDEACLPLGMQVLAQATLDYLAG